MMPQESQIYMAFMVRMWLAGDKPHPVWRASLENPHTGEYLVFGSVEGVLGYLVQATGSSVELKLEIEREETME